MTMTPHGDVGAYLLGALDDADMTRFEEHLIECAECARELDELSGLLPILDELRQEGDAFVRPPSGDAMLDRLLAEVRGERRTRKRRRLVAVAAAAVLVVGGPTAALLATQGDGNGGRPSASQTIAADRHWAINPATGASATVGIADKDWGSVVDLQLKGVHGPLTCSLIAIGANGAKQTLATWWVPDIGYGTATQPLPLTVHGAAGMHKDQIRRFDVRATDGTLLVSVPT